MPGVSGGVFPVFFIVILAYNRAALIGLTRASVQTQTLTDWELLVVDDGSSEPTADACFRYLPKGNAGRGAARKYRLARAGGRFFGRRFSPDYSDV